MSVELVEAERSMDLLSVIVSAEAMQELPQTLAAARSGLDAIGMPYEAICITDARVMAALESLRADWPELFVLGQRPWGGDDAALAVALSRARGFLVLALAGRPEVAPENLATLPAGLSDADMVSAARTGLPGGRWQLFRRRTFNRLLARLFGQSPSDPFCRTRLTRKAVLEDVAGFGVRQHFVPVIAGERGCTLAEIDVRSVAAGTGGTACYVFRPLGQMTAFLDALTLYVVLKFLRRPLRFFGSIGLPIFLLGTLATAVLVAQRLMGEPLADRPALIFAVLMVVLEIQIIAIGLVGEIIIFSNFRRMKQYAVRDIKRRAGAGEADRDASRALRAGKSVE